MRHKAVTLFAGFLLLFGVLTLTGCARRHHAAAPYYEISPGVRLPLNDAGESPQHRIVISADSTGTWLKLNGQKMAIPQFKAALRQQVAQHPEAAVIIDFPKRKEFVALFQTAMDAAQEANPKELMVSETPTLPDKQAAEKQARKSGTVSAGN